MKSRLRDFFFVPVSTAPQVLSVLRVVVAALVLVETLLLSGSLDDFYTSQGLLHPILNDVFSAKPGLPKLNSFLTWLSSIGIDDGIGIRLIYAFHITSALFLMLGWRVRLFAAIVCFLHVAIHSSGYYTAYGVDRYLHVMLFYLIWVPEGNSPVYATFLLRIVQLHLLVTYLSAGIEKAVGADWIQGEAVWRSLMLPGFGQWDVSWMPYVPVVSWIASWGTLVLEILYPVGLAFKKLRPYWVIAICLMHVGVALCLGMVFFSAVMVVLNLTLYLLPDWLGHAMQRRIVISSSAKNGVVCAG